MRQDIKLHEWFESVTQVAKRCKVSRWAVRKACIEGRIKASKIGNCWIIPKTEVVGRT